MKYLFKTSLAILLLLILSIVNKSCVNKENSSSQDPNQKDMKIETSNFGTFNGEKVFLYSLENKNGVKVKITNFGGIVTSIIVPDREGNFEDVVLGFDSLSGYLNEHPYFGSIVGRYGNRIAYGEFTLDGESYKLARNNGENHLHGGISGFDKKLWKSESFETEKGVGVTLNYTSPDLEEGYPGNLETTVTYLLTNENELKISYKATTDKASPINLTQHNYYNLTAGKENVLGHELRIKASKYVLVNDGLIPTGELAEVIGTDMDFLDFHTIGERIHQVPGGYDHSYVLDKKDEEYVLCVEVFEPKSGRLMEVFTTEPAIQLYTGNFLDGSLTGKSSLVYNQHYGFCLEAQHFPDSPNQPLFPNTILRPEEVYTQLTVYKFSVK